MRKLPSWVDGFVKYTDKMGSPPLFQRWAGIFTVAAALERRVAMRTNKGQLYPNLYVVMVGPPGVGKTVALGVGHDITWEALVEGASDAHHVAPTSLTKASLIDELLLAERKVVIPTNTPPVQTFNSLTLFSNELGTLLPAYESDFMSVLTDIYDCRIYAESRRTTGKRFTIDNPQLNFIAATTPSYLMNFLPEGAWEQGFLSRTMLAYGGEVGYTELFDDVAFDKELHSALIFDLRAIGRMNGNFTIDDDAKMAVRYWAKHGRPPEPDHPKLRHYNTRRIAHLLKLCMISSASTSSSLRITLDNYAEALDWLVALEAVMPDIFRSMTMGSASRIMDETWYFAYETFVRGGRKGGIPEYLLVQFLSERVPSHEVGRILEIMERSRILEKKVEAGVGITYLPRGKR